MTEDVFAGILTEYFAGGWRIAPFLKTPDGYIGVKAWPKRAATNPGELQALIDEHAEKYKKVPVMGIVPPRGRFVIDIDTKTNLSALQLWKDKVVEAFGSTDLALPEMVVRTKSGGFHLYYSDGSDKIINSPTNVFGKGSGVDIRGYTGMVIAPTSIGSMEEWQPGEYMIVKGRPTDKLTVLPIAKILGDRFVDEEDQVLRSTLHQINEALRNDSVPESFRHRLIPDSLIIPSSSRDNTLYRCARMCRLAGLSQDAAFVFMHVIAQRCEATDEEPVEHWIKLAGDKVRRVYASETEMVMQTIAALYEELDNAGTVLLRGTTKSYYYFRHGSSLLRIEPRSKYSTDNMPNVLQGVEIRTDEGPIPAKKVIGAYNPKNVAYSAAMYPRANLPFFDFEGLRYVNTYHDPFAAFEPTPELLEQAKPYVERFEEFTRHITGYEQGDDQTLLDKLAWILQRPYRRLPTGTIIYSHTKGTGKDNYMQLVRELVGRQYYMPIDLRSIEDSHTTLHDKLVCVASEVQLQTNARGSIGAANFIGLLKDLITKKTVYANEKFIQAYSAPIFANFFLLSNYELTPVIEPGDRRWDMFHATEEKMDQARFGDLVDIANDGVWIERGDVDRLFRKHVIYAIRRALQDRQISAHLDREEAKNNEVKLALMEHQNPPAIEWMMRNLPPYFTEEVVMMACHFCPMRTSPEYMMKQLREHYGPQFKSLYRTGRIAYRMNGAPKLERRDGGGMGSTLPVLNFDVKTSDMTARRSIHYFDNTIRPADPSDSAIKLLMRQWYEAMTARYFGNTTVLPGQKPDGRTDDVL